MSAAVSFTGVSRSFGRTRALADVSFQVPENSVCALLGPNGAGKTTAIRALLGLARTDAGEISVLGERPGSLAARSRLGYLPDVPAFPAWMTAREYLEASARLAGVPASTAGRRIDALLETAGLSSVRQRIGGYSRGMRQRLGIAQALIGAPGLLVLDEPTSALDPAGHREVLELIERLSGRTTVLLSSHNLAEADRVATHAVVLRAGRVLASSPVADLRRRAGALSLPLRADADADADAVLARQPWCKGVRREGGDLVLLVCDEDAAAHSIPALAAERSWGVRALIPLERSLEDVFLALTSDQRGAVRPGAPTAEDRPESPAASRPGDHGRGAAPQRGEDR